MVKTIRILFTLPNVRGVHQISQDVTSLCFIFTKSAPETIVSRYRQQWTQKISSSPCSWHSLPLSQRAPGTLSSYTPFLLPPAPLFSLPSLHTSLPRSSQIATPLLLVPYLISFHIRAGIRPRSPEPLRCPRRPIYPPYLPPRMADPRAT